MQQYMIQIINSLEKRGYMRLNPDSNNVYGRADGDTVYVVVIGSDRNLDAESLKRFNDKILLDVSMHSHVSVRLLNILVTPDGVFSDTTMNIVESLDGVWLFTEDCGKLYVFENQPEDFDDLYELIDKQTKADNDKSMRTLAGMFGIITPVLVALNIIVYAADKYASGITGGADLCYRLAINVEAIHSEGQYYRFFTSIFTHFGLEHLFGNMVVLIALGARIEGIAGRVNYFIIYITTGLVGSVLSYADCYYNDTYDYAAGASGAIFGLLGVLVVIAVANKGRVRDLSLTNMLILLILTVVNGFLSEGIDNVAHVGGFAAGLIAGVLLMLTNQKVVNRSHM